MVEAVNFIVQLHVMTVNRPELLNKGSGIVVLYMD